MILLTANDYSLSVCVLNPLREIESIVMLPSSISVLQFNVEQQDTSPIKRKQMKQIAAAFPFRSSDNIITCSFENSKNRTKVFACPEYWCMQESLFKCCAMGSG